MKSVTRLLSVATFERRQLARNVNQSQTSFRPVGLGHPACFELGLCVDPISKRVSTRPSVLKFHCAQ